MSLPYLLELERQEQMVWVKNGGMLSPLGAISFCERVTRIELVYRAWQARVITTILYPHFLTVVQVGIEPTRLLGTAF